MWIIYTIGLTTLSADYTEGTESWWKVLESAQASVGAVEFNYEGNYWMREGSGSFPESSLAVVFTGKIGFNRNDRVTRLTIHHSVRGGNESIKEISIQAGGDWPLENLALT